MAQGKQIHRPVRDAIFRGADRQPCTVVRVSVPVRAADGTVPAEAPGAEGRELVPVMQAVLQPIDGRSVEGQELVRLFHRK